MEGYLRDESDIFPLLATRAQIDGYRKESNWSMLVSLCLFDDTEWQKANERETTQHMSSQMSKCDYCCIRPSSVSINCARCSPLRSMKICGQCSIHVNQVREHSKLHPMSTYEVRGKAGRGGATRTRTSVHSSCWTFLWMIDRSVNGCVATKSI